MKFLSRLFSDDKNILNVFVILYSVAIFFEIFQARPNIVFYCSTHCSESLLSQMSAGTMSALLLLSLLISAALFLRYPWVFLLTTLLYFFVWRSYLICTYEPERFYLPWNHAIVFWVFLALGLTQWTGPRRTIQLIKFLILFSYFAGGIAKIRYGLEWMNGWSLQYLMLDRHLLLDTPLAWAIFHSLRVAQVLSWILVLAELSVPLAFLSPRLEWVYVVGFLIFQIICWACMKLLWMHFYGWTYLIYFVLLLEILFRKLRSKSLETSP